MDTLLNMPHSLSQGISGPLVIHPITDFPQLLAHLFTIADTILNPVMAHIFSPPKS
jgi:hypothetical protein